LYKSEKYCLSKLKKYQISVGKLAKSRKMYTWTVVFISKKKEKDHSEKRSFLIVLEGILQALPFSLFSILMP
jgi:hypothetical protein